MSEIEACLERNAHYTAGIRSQPMPARPGLGLAIVACMDARLDPRALLGLQEGDAHVIRNAGGVVTDDVLRSLMISQHRLQTREIMLIHHTDCGMMTFTDEEFAAVVESETGHRPPFPMQAFPDLEESVRHSVARLRGSPLLPHREIVRGFVCEIDSGRLREID